MIPKFNNKGLLPPFIGEEGDERVHGNLSPYFVSITEFCKRFATNRQRVRILKKFISFRKEIINNDIKKGFQWVYGSFVEDIEKTELRSPSDMDVMTFYMGLSNDKVRKVYDEFPVFFKEEISKKKYMIDHTSILIDYSPINTVESMSESMQLCTHTRDGEWKGIIKIDLNTLKEDKEALHYLNSFSFENSK